MTPCDHIRNQVPEVLKVTSHVLIALSIWVMLIIFYFIFTSQTQPIKKKKARLLQSVNQMYFDLENKLVFKTFIHYEYPIH